jgi:glutamine synthetase
LRLLPDLGRVTALAAQPGWAWAPVDRYLQDGQPYPGCQRTFARRMAQLARDRGLEIRMGFEVEWALGREDDDASFVPGCRGPAYGMGRLVELSDYTADVHDALAAEGFTVLQIHPEYAPGQFECSVAPADPVAAADAVVLVRETIRALSLAYGMRASFAPVVAAGGVGNGSHLHVSLWRDGRNLFSSGEGRYGLAAEGESFLSAVLAHLPALVGLSVLGPGKSRSGAAPHRRRRGEPGAGGERRGEVPRFRRQPVPRRRRGARGGAIRVRRGRGAAGGGDRRSGVATG